MIFEIFATSFSSFHVSRGLCSSYYLIYDEYIYNSSRNYWKTSTVLFLASSYCLNTKICCAVWKWTADCFLFTKWIEDMNVFGKFACNEFVNDWKHVMFTPDNTMRNTVARNETLGNSNERSHKTTDISFYRVLLHRLTPIYIYKNYKRLVVYLSQCCVSASLLCFCVLFIFFY